MAITDITYLEPATFHFARTTVENDKTFIRGRYKPLAANIILDPIENNCHTRKSAKGRVKSFEINAH